MKKYFLIYLPFLLFSVTYIYLIYYYQKEKILVPKLIGMLLTDLTMEHSADLIFKIVKVTYNKEYEDNYIIGQYPLPGALIRPNQIISLEINSNKNKVIKKLSYKANEENLTVIKDNYKKEGISYKIIYFNTSNSNLKKITTVYDKNKNITYVYVATNTEIPKVYIKNIVGKLCTEITSKDLINCYILDNIMINKCSGFNIVNQFPLPGVYSKNRNKIKIHAWHK
jgi:hypothetical protein